MGIVKRILLNGYAIVATLAVVALFALFWQMLVENHIALLPVSGFSVPIPIPIPDEQFRGVYIDGKPIFATVVDTPETRAKGLSGRKSLAANEGMLFIFPDDGIYGFWMKDMLFPIDIVWISADKRVVHVDSDVSPITYPRVFEPPLPVRYVLELPAGKAKEYNALPGSNVGL